jgi:putative Mg2+ transporter-C (MgtC) family protein
MRVTDVWHISELELTLRLLSAALLGGMIGLEREWNNHAAGFRTHILVCIGSAAIMLLSMYGFEGFADEPNVQMDPARLAAQVNAGIGFLGAGAILRNGGSVSGLTTAASIWVVAAIGLSAGAGFLYLAALSAVLVVVSLFLLNKLEKRMMRGRRQSRVVVRMLDRPGRLCDVADAFEAHGVRFENVRIAAVDDEGAMRESTRTVELRFDVKASSREKLYLAVDRIGASEGVRAIRVETRPDAESARAPRSPDGADSKVG